MLALPILLAVHVLAWAGWDEGVAAYNQGNYDTALREWRPLAEQGHADAQHTHCTPTRPCTQSALRVLTALPEVQDVLPRN
jgi:hypothetical protein